ncbi:MAG: hypothetical protein JRE45_12330 [Deltaproteobacteria bacterium]|nr:hypothetical protein [Deltaproteobacteria bacterium]MBW1874936.1 hypothetical protein [Deltaproteobacteria bacterium]MBW2162580.1 hypothetical protein [Deltaproteobacteria bacterium]MBW2552139.1 hypothetical protein [Deltaproteobacteria bacterium]MBW2628401.1 hypothetical protein [Deltaproteobacteria bacterium]
MSECVAVARNDPVPGAATRTGAVANTDADMRADTNAALTRAREPSPPETEALADR